MALYFFSIGLTVLSNVLYQLFQKSISPQVNPFVSLIITYSTAIIFSAICLPFYLKGQSILLSFKELNWASYALGIAIVGLEFGFLLAYRAGWNLNRASLFSSVAVTLLLIPVGAMLFREKLNIINIIGIGFSVIGLVLMNHK
ncbi:EamA-like transporter family protein [Peptococcaceae bacterium CEB3]|nr:EamA-like transporter family protein [Peptococcaceae bacterium CEB3]